FTSPDDLRDKVGNALRRWRDDHPEFAKPVAPAGKADTSAYRKWLREETAWIDIRGLQTGDENAHRFPITDLYIPLMNERAEPDEAAGKRGMMREPGRERLPLDEALKHRKLVIVGDPGSGKTTFLRHIAFGLHEAGGTEFPVLIRIAELAAHIAHHRPANPEAPSLLLDFLVGRSQETEWELDKDFFRQRMKDGTALVLLDGLDEAPGEETRKTISSLLEK
ncbi:MAG: NACHT domain-containing protein, partial [bacterium]|nr:NACHT domain-containing protein [bacterium]